MKTINGKPRIRSFSNLPKRAVRADIWDVPNPSPDELFEALFYTRSPTQVGRWDMLGFRRRAWKIAASEAKRGEASEQS